MTFSKKPKDFTEETAVKEQDHLYWYDRPILFPMVTDRGQELCMLIEEIESETNGKIEEDIYVSVLISEDELQNVIGSHTDLRTAFKGEDKKPRMFIWNRDRKDTVRFQELEGSLPETYLPREGAYLDIEVTQQKRALATN